MRQTKVIGLITFAILFLLALIFYKERTIFIDSSFVLFSVLKDKALAIQNFRFGAAFPQIVALISCYLGFPLKAIMILYSLSFVILSFGLYSFINFWLKNEKLSLVLLLFNVLMVSSTFYWMHSEQIQGTAWLVLYFALQFDNPLKTRYPEINSAISYLLLFLVAFVHPIMIFQFSFFILFLILSNTTYEGLTKKIELIVSFGVFIVIYYIKIVFFKNTYDSGAIDNVKNFIDLFPNYFTLQSNKNFIYYVLTDYYLVILVLIASSLLYFRTRNWKKLLLLNICFFGYLLLVNVSYKNGADKFYIESHYLSLSLFVIIPFVFDLLPLLSISKRTILISGIIALRLVHIFMSHIPVTDRLNWEREYLSKTESLPNKKIVTSNAYVPMDKLMMIWSSPYEFWLLSTLEQNKSRSILILDIESELDWALSSKNTFLTRWGTFNYSELPSKYFIMTDTTSYVKLKNKI